jgi:hypothetical protein
MLRRTEHSLLLVWLLITGVVAVAAWVCVDRGLLAHLVETDRSYVSVIVIAMYLFGLAHSFRRTWEVSCELNRAAGAEQILAAGKGAPLTLVDGGLVCGETALPRGFLSSYVADLVNAREAPDLKNKESGDPGADLLEAHTLRWRGANEFGWFLIDLMLKVGFLGTLIGFIWMLASVSQHEMIDASSMQTILKQMSLGMAIALNTTLSSLVAGILLSLPYYLLGRGLEEILECTVRLTRVEILPRLQPAAAG